jgi:hypothetical protein
MTAHEQISNLISTSGSKLVSVTFVKKDGTERQLTFNPADHNDIKGTGTTCQDPNIFRIRDIKLGQWRSFDARRCVSVKVSGTVHQIQQDDA